MKVGVKMPYDRIIVTAAAEKDTDELISQLKPGENLLPWDLKAGRSTADYKGLAG